MKVSLDKIALGLTDDEVPLGSHVMYDINTLSGRLVLDGGFGTHSLAVCRSALRHNPYCATDNKSIAA